MWRTGLVAPLHVGSSRTRARTRVPCIGRRILNHCATREAQSWVNLYVRCEVLFFDCGRLPALAPLVGKAVCPPLNCCCGLHCGRISSLDVVLSFSFLWRCSCFVSGPPSSPQCLFSSVLVASVSVHKVRAQLRAPAAGPSAFSFAGWHSGRRGQWRALGWAGGALQEDGVAAPGPRALSSWAVICRPAARAAL